MTDSTLLDDQVSSVKDCVKIVYVEGFDKPTANVILKAADGVMMRVHDYHLKASSQFFRELLEAVTKGGTIPLEANGSQLKFMLDKAVGRIPKKKTLRDIAGHAPAKAINANYSMLWSLIDLDRLARKYLFDGVTTFILECIAFYSHSHPPMALALACQQTPPNGYIAYNALAAFSDSKPLWMDKYFRPRGSHNVDSDGESIQESNLSPKIQYRSNSFAQDLGWEGMLAYARATDQSPPIALISTVTGKTRNAPE